MEEYDNWMKQQTPENMGVVIKALSPVINSEIQRFSGPKPLLRSRAKSLAIKAVRTWDPNSGAQLRSWVVTQMQPLARYGQKMRPVHAPETAIRQAAEVNRVSQEMSDEYGREPSETELADRIGISAKRVGAVRRMVKPTLSEGSMAEPISEDSTAGLPGVSEINKLNVAEEAVYDSLNSRDRAIFDLKTGKHGSTQISNQEIARRMGVSPALISQRSQQIAMQIYDLNAKGIL